MPHTAAGRLSPRLHPISAVPLVCRLQLLCSRFPPKAIAASGPQSVRREAEVAPLARGAVHSGNPGTRRRSCLGLPCQEEEDAVYVLYTFAQSLDLLRIVSPRNRCDAIYAGGSANAR